MNFEAWLTSVPSSVTNDPLWRMKVYQYAEFIAEVGWHDVTELVKDKRTISLADQLNRALGSMSANIAEGYSHGTSGNRVRYYEYALGSARETRSWYFKTIHVLRRDVVLHRMDFVAHIIQMLLTIIPEERGKAMKEERAMYAVPSSSVENIDFTALTKLHTLLEDIPL